MEKKTSGTFAFFRLKKIAEQLNELGLSDFERVALRSEYSAIVEAIREKAAR